MERCISRRKFRKRRCPGRFYSTPSSHSRRSICQPRIVHLYGLLLSGRFFQISLTMAAFMVFMASQSLQFKFIELKQFHRYHEQCVQHLLRLSSEDIQHDRGFHLAAVCTLRSYEILAEDFDPNRHLSGAYAFSAAPSPAMDRPSLWRAGFFNYLREDITFSLMNRTALKIDLTDMEIPDSAFDDEDQLNVAALHLAEAVNLRFGEECKTHLCEKVSDRFRRWSESLPSQFTPFYDDTSGVTPAVFPTIRLLRDCHVAVVQYGLVTASLLAENTASSELESTLEANAIRICGLAFTSSSPTVLVNSFGPISYCGCHIRDQALQADLIRRLHSSQKDTGWPVQRMIEGLEKYWNTPRGPQIDATCDSPT